MLLKANCRDAGYQGDDEATSISSRAAAMRFMEAVSGTKPLSRPKYISLATCAE